MVSINIPQCLYHCSRNISKSVVLIYLNEGILNFFAFKTFLKREIVLNNIKLLYYQYLTFWGELLHINWEEDFIMVSFCQALSSLWQINILDADSAIDRHEHMGFPSISPTSGIYLYLRYLYTTYLAIGFHLWLYSQYCIELIQHWKSLSKLSASK